MSKNIIFCADGTWNTPSGGPPTNVYKFYKALTESDTQTAKYDDGVGTSGVEIERLLGGAFGDGLFQKIKDGYDWIAQVYADGDRIYLLGFSRGAYTARSLAGMLAISGLPVSGRYTPQATEDAFQAYRDTANRATLLPALKEKYGNRDVTIAMVGVWDTVGALGIPGGLFANFDSQFYGFLDTSLHPNIGAAFQALAVDEQRNEFVPTLWDASQTPGQKLQQVWFSGVHSDVGGGYAETELSDITLGWMMKNASDCGLLFDTPVFGQYFPLQSRCAGGTLHTSWSMLWGLPQRRSIPAGSLIANSVCLRMTQLPAYVPSNIPKGFPKDPGGMSVDELLAA